MRKLTFLTTLPLMLLMVSAATAGTIRLGTGPERGAYFPMGSNLQTYCQKALGPGGIIEAAKTTGSVDNLDGIKNKAFTAGIVQEDVLQYFAKQDPSNFNGNRIKVISGLHMETIYLLIPKDYKPKGGGSMLDQLRAYVSGPSAQELSLAVLEGQDVAASGGAAVSAKALKFFSGVNFNVVETDPAKAIGMPAILVGGSPYQPVQDLLATGKYVLVNLDSDSVQARAPFYSKTTANYNVGGKQFSAKTIGVRALLVGKAFRDEARNKDMIRLGACIEKNMADLADDPDTNPNWGSAFDLNEDGQQVNWPYFPLK